MADGLSIVSENRVYFTLWGDFSVADALTGEDLRPRGRKARGLVAYLACHAGRSVSRERLADLFWGDRGEAQARSSLRQAIFELRALGPAGRKLIAIARDHIRLDPKAMTSDMIEIEAAARRGDHNGLMAIRPAADARWLGNLDGLGESFDDWLAIERTARDDALDALVKSSRPAIVQPRFPALLPPRLVRPRLWGRAALAAGLSALVAGLPAGTGGGVRVPPSQTAPRPAAAAERALVATPAVEQARTLLQTARSLLRTRNPEQVHAAIKLLQRAHSLDPGLAAAWAVHALGLTLTADEAAAGVNFRKAESMARRALAIDPRSADAHAALGMVLGFGSAEARGHLETAVALAPDDPEKLFWLSNVRLAAGDFPGQLALLRRSVAIDPWWARTAIADAVTSWNLGDARGAEAAMRRAAAADPWIAVRVPVELAAVRGEPAEVVRRAVRARATFGQTVWLDDLLGSALLTMGEAATARPLLGVPAKLWPIVTGAAPTVPVLGVLNSGCPSSEVDGRLIKIALRTLLHAGRGGAAVALYDSGQGCLGGLAPGKVPDLQSLMELGPAMALALRQTGREAEATALLNHVDTAARTAMVHAAVPPWLLVGAAEAAAALGNPDAAIAALGTAASRGWLGPEWTQHPDIADVPALASLAGNPRFESLRERLRARIDAQHSAIAPQILQAAAAAAPI